MTPSERINEGLRNTICWGEVDFKTFLLEELDALDRKLNRLYTEGAVLFPPEET